MALTWVKPTGDCALRENSGKPGTQIRQLWPCTVFERFRRHRCGCAIRWQSGSQEFRAGERSGEIVLVEIVLAGADLELDRLRDPPDRRD